MSIPFPSRSGHEPEFAVAAIFRSITRRDRCGVGVAGVGAGRFDCIDARPMPRDDQDGAEVRGILSADADGAIAKPTSDSAQRESGESIRFDHGNRKDVDALNRPFFSIRRQIEKQSYIVCLCPFSDDGTNGLFRSGPILDFA